MSSSRTRCPYCGNQSESSFLCSVCQRNLNDSQKRKEEEAEIREINNAWKNVLLLFEKIGFTIDEQIAKTVRLEKEQNLPKAACLWIKFESGWSSVNLHFHIEGFDDRYIQKINDYSENCFDFTGFRIKGYGKFYLQLLFSRYVYDRYKNLQHPHLNYICDDQVVFDLDKDAMGIYELNQQSLYLRPEYKLGPHLEAYKQEPAFTKRLTEVEKTRNEPASGSKRKSAFWKIILGILFLVLFFVGLKLNSSDHNIWGYVSCGSFILISIWCFISAWPDNDKT